MLYSDCSRILGRICQGRGQKKTLYLISLISLNFLFLFTISTSYSFAILFFFQKKFLKNSSPSPPPFLGGPVWVKSVCHPDGVGGVEQYPRHHFTPRTNSLNAYGLKPLL